MMTPDDPDEAGEIQGVDESPFSIELLDPYRNETERHDPAEASDDALSNPEDA